MPQTGYSAGNFTVHNPELSGYGVKRMTVESRVTGRDRNRINYLDVDCEFARAFSASV